MRIARLGLAAALGVLYGATLGSVGHAAEPDCKTVVTHLKDRPDNGHGTPSVLLGVGGVTVLALRRRKRIDFTA